MDLGWPCFPFLGLCRSGDVVEAQEDEHAPHVLTGGDEDTGPEAVSSLDAIFRGLEEV